MPDIVVSHPGIALLKAAERDNDIIFLSPPPLACNGCDAPIFYPDGWKVKGQALCEDCATRKAMAILATGKSDR